MNIVQGLLVALQDFKDEYDKLDLLYDEPNSMTIAHMKAEAVIKQTKDILNESSY